MANEFTWGGVLTCNTAGGGLGADCNGYPQNAFRYDTPTWWGFSMSTSYGEDDMWDVALKYAADWNSMKVLGGSWLDPADRRRLLGTWRLPWRREPARNVAVVGGGGTPFQNFRQDGQLFQVGASIMHVPSGLFAYGLYQNDQEDGTQFKNFNFHTGRVTGDAAANDTNTWFVKAGIKRAWMPAGATVLFGEWGQYNDMFRGLCGERARQPQPASATASAWPTHSDRRCRAAGPAKGAASVTAGSLVTGSEVNRWGIGVVQEINSAAMHLFARWQHLDLNLDAVSFDNATV